MIFSIFRVQILKTSPNGEDLTLTFPKGKSLYDVDWLGFISRKKKVTTHLTLLVYIILLLEDDHISIYSLNCLINFRPCIAGLL